MLRCPADSHPLVSHSQGVASFAVCGECAGVWIDGETLARSAPEPDAGEYDAVRARLAPPSERPVAGGRAVARPDGKGESSLGEKVANGVLHVGVEGTFTFLVGLLLS